VHAEHSEQQLTALQDDGPLPSPRGPRTTSMSTPARVGEPFASHARRSLGGVFQRFSILSHLVWGYVSLTRLAAAVDGPEGEGHCLRRRPSSHSRCGGSSVACQLVGRASSGVRGAAEKVGEQFEFGVPISGTDLVHRGVHPRVKAHQLRVPLA
jgi:hypothetical protein